MDKHKALLRRVKEGKIKISDTPRGKK